VRAPVRSALLSALVVAAPGCAPSVLKVVDVGVTGDAALDRATRAMVIEQRVGEARAMALVDVETNAGIDALPAVFDDDVSWSVWRFSVPATRLGRSGALRLGGAGARAPAYTPLAHHVRAEGRDGDAAWTAERPWIEPKSDDFAAPRCGRGVFAEAQDALDLSAVVDVARGTSTTAVVVGTTADGAPRVLRYTRRGVVPARLIAAEAALEGQRLVRLIEVPRRDPVLLTWDATGTHLWRVMTDGVARLALGDGRAWLERRIDAGVYVEPRAALLLLARDLTVLEVAPTDGARVDPLATPAPLFDRTCVPDRRWRGDVEPDDRCAFVARLPSDRLLFGYGDGLRYGIFDRARSETIEAAPPDEAPLGFLRPDKVDETGRLFSIARGAPTAGTYRLDVDATRFEAVPTLTGERYPHVWPVRLLGHTPGVLLGFAAGGGVSVWDKDLDASCARAPELLPGLDEPRALAEWESGLLVGGVGSQPLSFVNTR
jgi:hypothetical protein